jgi:hypothetical protein
MKVVLYLTKIEFKCTYQQKQHNKKDIAAIFFFFVHRLQEEYYREKINFIRMQNERETEQLEIQKRRLQIEERRRDVVEALLEKILKN